MTGPLASWLLGALLLAPPNGAIDGAPAETETPSETEAGPAPPIEPPVPISTPEAPRPEARADETIEVLVLLELDASGRVTRVELVEGVGEPFDGAVLDAAREFRFEPAREAGEAIAVEIEYRYVFRPLEPEPEAPDEPPVPDELPTPDESEVVRGGRIETPIAAARMDRAEAETTPGAQGDVGRALETLAGVARPNLTGGELVVWGAAASDTRTYVEWIPIPRLFHVGGARSNLPNAMVSGVELTPAGFDVGWGRAIGGRVKIETRPPRSATAPRRAGGWIRADALDLGTGMDARLGQRGWLTAGVRRSLLRQTYGNLLPAASRELVPLPDTWDYQAKVTIELDARDELALYVLGAHDQLLRSIPSLTPDQSFGETRTAGFHRLGLGLHRQRDDGSSLRVSTWAGFDHDEVDQSFVDASARDRSRVWAGGLRLDERRRVAPFLVVSTGLDLEYRHTDTRREGALSLPAREGDVVVFGQHPGDRLARDRWGVHQLGLAGYLALAFGPETRKWTIEPGIRVEPMVTVGDRVLPVRPIEPEVGYNELEVALDPRLSARWSPSPAVELFAAGGRYHQAPPAGELSPIFGNPRLRAIEAVHTLAGIATRPARWLDLGLTGFWIRSWQLPVRSPSPTPELATVLVSQGQGQSFGGQVSARVRPGHGLSFALAYTLQRALRTAALDEGERPSWRLFDGDQAHILQVLAGWIHRSGVELGARASLSSGNPRTPVESAVFDAVSGRWDPVFGEQNSTRLPLFFELSLRVGWRRSWDWGQLRVWLDVRNATNQRNASEVFYSSDFSSQGFVTGLPIVPALGVELGF